MFCSKTYKTAAALSRMSQSEILGGILRGGRGPVAALATQGLPPMPHWQPDPEEEREAARWPLRPSIAPGYFQSHTAFSGVSLLRRREGAPCCILHPDEAGRTPSQRRRARASLQRSGVGRTRPQGQRRGSARKCARARTAPRRRNRRRDDQHTVLRPVHGYRRRGHIPEYPARYCGLGGPRAMTSDRAYLCS